MIADHIIKQVNLCTKTQTESATPHWLWFSHQRPAKHGKSWCSHRPLIDQQCIEFTVYPNIAYTVTGHDKTISKLRIVYETSAIANDPSLNNYLYTCSNLEQRLPLWKQQLCLLIDRSQIWRCGGRMSNSDLSPSGQFPNTTGHKASPNDTDSDGYP